MTAQVGSSVAVVVAAWNLPLYAVPALVAAKSTADVVTVDLWQLRRLGLDVEEGAIQHVLTCFRRSVLTTSNFQQARDGRQ